MVVEFPFLPKIESRNSHVRNVRLGRNLSGIPFQVPGKLSLTCLLRRPTGGELGAFLPIHGFAKGPTLPDRNGGRNGGTLVANGGCGKVRCRVGPHARSLSGGRFVLVVPLRWKAALTSFFFFSGRLGCGARGGYRPLHRRFARIPRHRTGVPPRGEIVRGNLPHHLTPYPHRPSEASTRAHRARARRKQEKKIRLYAEMLARFGIRPSQESAPIRSDWNPAALVPA